MAGDVKQQDEALVDVLWYLLCGASVNGSRGSQGDTPVILAARKGR